MFNKHDETATFDTDIIDVISYVLPEVEIEGSRIAFIGDSLTLEAVLTNGDQQLDSSSFNIEWFDSRTDTQLGTGPTLSFTSEKQAWVYVEAVVTSQSHIDSGLDISVNSRASFSFYAPRGPSVSIIGDTYIDDDVPREQLYKATFRTPFAGMNIPIHGKFILPDSTEIDATEWTYDTATRMLGAGYHNLIYEAWLEGYEDYKTRASKYLSVKSYQFPSFAFSNSWSRNIVPFERTYTIRSYGVPGTYAKDFNITWDLPSGVSIVNDFGVHQKRLRFENPGTNVLQFTASDHLDNQFILTDHVEATAPDPYNIETSVVSTKRSVSIIRDPYPAGIITRISGGHPDDWPTRYVHRINNEVVSDKSFATYTYVTLGEGDYQIDSTVSTRLGQIITNSVDLSVAANEPPTCGEPTILTTASSWKVYFECDDPDGRVKAYYFPREGSELVQKTSLNYILVYSRSEPVNLTYYVEDDSGAFSRTYSLTLTPQ